MALESALALIESVKDQKVLFVGDCIVDEYQYVTPLGKSPKENIVPVFCDGREIFQGGVEAAAKHAASFCAKVEIASFGKITRKVRFVDMIYLRKLFEAQFTEGEKPNQPLKLDGIDSVVVTDFGHGAVMPFAINGLCDSSIFLSVNAQTNSANVGFNLITKYRRADYIVIDEGEARLAAQDRESNIADVMFKLANGRCQKIVITRGVHGAIGGELKDGTWRFAHIAAITTRVIDTMGAGDAFLAVTAPMAKTGSIEDLLLIGNAAGALKTQIIGHRESVTKEKLIAYMNEHCR